MLALPPGGAMGPKETKPNKKAANAGRPQSFMARNLGLGLVGLHLDRT